MDLAGVQSRLAALGVRRVSWGPQLARASYGWLKDQVTELLSTTSSALPDGLDFGALQALGRSSH